MLSCAHLMYFRDNKSASFCSSSPLCWATSKTIPAIVIFLIRVVSMKGLTAGRFQTATQLRKAGVSIFFRLLLPGPSGPNNGTFVFWLKWIKLEAFWTMLEGSRLSLGSVLQPPTRGTRCQQYSEAASLFLRSSEQPKQTFQRYSGKTKQPCFMGNWSLRRCTETRRKSLLRCDHNSPCDVIVCRYLTALLTGQRHKREENWLWKAFHKSSHHASFRCTDLSTLRFRAKAATIVLSCQEAVAIVIPVKCPEECPNCCKSVEMYLF